MAEVRGVAPGSLIGALLLAGCVAGGPVTDPSAVEVPQRPGEVKPLPEAPGWAPSLTAVDGAEVPVAIWGPERPSAVILALHGYGGHGVESFTNAAKAWAGKGIATVAPDQRGFGRNPSRGIWPGADALIADAEGYTAQLRAHFPCTPLILLGHSMGGGIALAAAPKADVDALILSAPAIWGGQALKPLHRVAAWLAVLAVPDTRFSGRGVVRIQASDNIEALRALARDPLYLSPPSAREMFGLMRVTDRAAEAAARTRVPTLMLLGEKDQIVPEDPVRRVFARLPGKTDIIAYPDGWHLLFRDLQAQRVWADVARFTLDQPKPECPS